MATNITIFCIIVAAIIVITRVLLEVSMLKDRRRGLTIHPEEYRMSSLLRMVFRDGWTKLKSLFRKKKKKESEGEL